MRLVEFSWGWFGLVHVCSVSFRFAISFSFVQFLRDWRADNEMHHVQASGISFRLSQLSLGCKLSLGLKVEGFGLRSGFRFRALVEV